MTFEDIKNKADYKAGGAGIKVNKNNDAEYNEKGITPDIGMPASGEAESKTKATISKGTIEIRDKDKQKQDIEKLNRDTANSLNKLGEIFDKTKIEERQELANLFGELAYNEMARRLCRKERSLCACRRYHERTYRQWLLGRSECVNC